MMDLEKVPPSLQGVGKDLFRLMRDLAGGDHGLPARQKSGWWRAPAKGKVCLYLYFLGNHGRTKRPNSVRLTTLMDDELRKLPWVEEGNNWFGLPSADYYLRPDDPKARDRAEQFIRHAYRARAVDLFAESAKDDTAIREFKGFAREVAANTQRDVPAAHRIKELLKKVSGVAAQAIVDIFVNVASEAAKRALLGP